MQSKLMEERDRNADDTDLYGFLTEKIIGIQMS